MSYCADASKGFCGFFILPTNSPAMVISTDVSLPSAFYKTKSRSRMYDRIVQVQIGLKSNLGTAC